MDFGWRDEEVKEEAPAGKGSLTKRREPADGGREEENYLLLIVFYARRRERDFLREPAALSDPRSPLTHTMMSDGQQRDDCWPDWQGGSAAPCLPADLHRPSFILISNQKKCDSNPKYRLALFSQLVNVVNKREIYTHMFFSTKLNTFHSYVCLCVNNTFYSFNLKRT